MTPLPEAKPSALITAPLPEISHNLRHLYKKKIQQKEPVLIPSLFINCLLNTLLDSSFCCFYRTKILKPLFMNSSTIPSANGLSGPTMVSAIISQQTSLFYQSLNSRSGYSSQSHHSPESRRFLDAVALIQPILMRVPCRQNLLLKDSFSFQ